MNKSTQLIIGMLLGFEKDHEIYEGISWDSNMAGELLKENKITKEDVFSLTSNGKSFFEYKEAWENIQKLFLILKENKEEVSIKDLSEPIKTAKTLIDLATDHNGLKELFAPEFWVGHSNEMEDAWYSILKGKRIGIGFPEIKNAVAKLENRKTRETQLKEMSIEPMDMRNAIRDGKLDIVKAALEKNGDYLRLDDVRLCDEDGDHALHTKLGWDAFEKLYEEFEKNGEVPDTDFFLFKRGERLSIIEQTFRHNAEKLVFNAKVFAGRPEELMSLYNTLSEENQKKIEIREVLSNIIEGISADKITINEELSIEKLTTTLYQFEEEKSLENWQPIIGLSLKKVWDNIDHVHTALENKNQNMTLRDLRLSSGFNGETCLIRAARFGHFEKVMDLLSKTQENLTLNDILDKEENSESLLDVLIKTNQVEDLLRPEHWSGNANDLCTIWDNIPADAQEKLKDSFKSTQTQVNLLSLRKLATLNQPAASFPSPSNAP